MRNEHTELLRFVFAVTINTDFHLKTQLDDDTKKETRFLGWALTKLGNSGFQNLHIL